MDTMCKKQQPPFQRLPSPPKYNKTRLLQTLQIWFTVINHHQQSCAPSKLNAGVDFWIFVWNDPKCLSRPDIFK